MNDSISTTDITFSKYFKDFGEIHLRPFNLSQDIATVYGWVTKPYAQYWGMQNKTIAEVSHLYEGLCGLAHYEVFIGMHNNQPLFLMEKYKTSEDRIANYYKVADGDYGMHILVAPPTTRIPSLTWNVFTTLLDYFFSKSEVSRVVVEPDVTNQKIHLLNKKAGFQYQTEIDLPEKRAALAFCSQAQYVQACNSKTEK